MLFLLMIVQNVNFIECTLQILLIEQLFIHRDIGYLHKVLHHIVVNLSCRVSHVHSPLEFGFGKKVRKPGTVIDVEMCDENQVDIFRVDDVEIGQRLHSLFARMDAAVHEHLASFALNVNAGAADFIARPKRCDLKEVATRSLNLMGLNCLIELLPQSLHIHYYLFIINIIIMGLKLLLLIILLSAFNLA